MTAAKKKHWVRPKSPRRTVRTVGRKAITQAVLAQSPGPRHGKPFSIAVHLGWDSDVIVGILEKHKLWRRERDIEQGGVW